MSVPLDSESSQSSSGYEDGLGRRALAFDRETGGMLERLVLRPELSAFEDALKERIAIVGGLEDERFARPRGVERDGDGRLTVVSEYLAGRRLSDIIEAAAEHGIVAGLDAGIGVLLELLPAVARLHDAGLAHGSLAPGRVMITPAGQIVLLDSIYAEPLERLKLTRKRLWAEFRLAFPPTAGLPRFHKAADLGHASMVAATLIVGRALQDADYPEGVSILRQEILEIASIRGSKGFAEAVDKFFASTLPLAGRRTTPSADEAAIDLRKLVRKELGINTCRTGLVEFFQQVEIADAERLTALTTEQAQSARAIVDTPAHPHTESARLEAERVEAERVDNARREQERAEQARREQERAEHARVEAERVAREHAEQARAEQERAENARLEAERIEREKAETARLERERAEKARLEAERLEAERIAREQDEKVRLEAERAQKARLEAERIEREKAENARLEQERAEKARLEAERLEAERVAREKAEKARLEAERAEKARLEAERLEAERIARENAEKARLEAERAEQARIEAERIAREKAEKARLEAERAEKARLEAERIEAERIAREKAEKARLEAERLERERLDAERRERERLEAERAEKARLEAERLAREKAEKARLEAERLEKERAEKARIEAERVEAERIAREKAEKARLEAERLEKERAEKARLEAERIERELQEKARLAAERREKERLEAERIEKERAEKARLENERLERERAEAARLAEEARLKAERLERERLEAQREAEKARLESERLANERLEAERRERERVEADRRERERQERERLEADRAAAERAERERADAARLERERAAAAAAPAPPPVPPAPPPPAPASSWLVSPDRAASFEPTGQQAPPPAPTARAYPIYVPPSEPVSWTPDVPPPTPAPIQVVPVAARPPKLAPPTTATPASSGTGIRLKLQDDTLSERSARSESRREPETMSAAEAYQPFVNKSARRPIPWKLIAAGVVVIAGAFAVSKGYTPSSDPVVGTVRKALPSTAAPKAGPPTVAGNVGRVVINTQPGASKILLDGKPVGESPLTLESVSPGRHVLTITGAGGSVRRNIRVEAGKTLTVDVALFSGFAAIAAPFVVDVSENGKALGTNENPILLSPGRHQLRIANDDLGYVVTETVEIQAGEVTRVRLDPRGTANINAAPWAEVFIDGEKAGETPMANFAIRLGVRDIVFRNPQYPDRKLTVTVKANNISTIAVDFLK